MKAKKVRQLSFIAILCLGIQFSALASNFPVTSLPGTSLEDCFQAAIHRSETIADQDELILQAEERYHQAVGSVLPTVNGVGTYFQQQQPNTGLSTTITPANQRTIKLVGTEHLFEGLREYAGLRQARRLKEAQDDTKKQALILLYENTAQIYYSLLSSERQVSNFQDEIPLYQKRIKELRDRIRIGRSREPESLTVEASLAQLQAQLEQAQLLVRTNREAFAFLTGLPNNTQIADVVDLNLEQTLTDLPSYLSAIEKRPEILGQQLRISAADEGIQIARGGHLPTLDLLGDYYFQRPTGIVSGINWDFQLTLTLPIFAGGVIQSGVRVAASQEREAELQLSANRRTLNQTIRTIYTSVISDRTQVRILLSAKEIADRNYKAETRDYRLGLVTNIDVLQALTTFQEAVRTLDVARYTAEYDYMRLQAETGRARLIQF